MVRPGPGLAVQWEDRPLLVPGRVLDRPQRVAVYHVVTAVALSLPLSSRIFV